MSEREIPTSELARLAGVTTATLRKWKARGDLKLAPRSRSGDCWLWTGALDSSGRGRVWRNGKLTIHHRAVWEVLVGPIPAGAMLCHHCDNPTCGNPAHLYIGDGKSNVRDMFARGRHWTQQQPERAKAITRISGLRNDWSRGSRNPKAKLSPEDVAEIRCADGSSYAVARRFGVHSTTVQRIRKGETWQGF